VSLNLKSIYYLALHFILHSPLISSKVILLREVLGDLLPSTGVPNLGYMYPQGYISLSEGVHLKLTVEDRNIFTYYLIPNIYTYIS